MWLLNTSSGRLRFFDNPSNVRYAILSHVWRDNEQSFQELEALMRAYHTPRKHASAKIRKCCIYAKRDGYEWLWVDTCCIDKTSSAELSEAINSMFIWYAQAAVCYAFLDDVSEKEDHCAPGSMFRKSAWWTRGWTLQELIAPKHVVFLSQSWMPIGTKTALAEAAEEISGVDRAILLCEISLDAVSVARRMSWASRRHTTREEDRAYSLLGIFNVTMPTIYGEGRGAFFRLQKEILKYIPDQSIFVWGPILHDYPFSCNSFVADVEEEANSSAPFSHMQSLLAPSPDEFASAAGIRSIPVHELSRSIGRRIRVENPSYDFTSYGIHTQFPIISYQLVPCLTIFVLGNHCAAILACKDHEEDRLLLLLLRNKPNARDDHYVGELCKVASPTEDPAALVSLRPMYHRVASLARSMGPVDDLAYVRKVFIHNAMSSEASIRTHWSQHLSMAMIRPDPDYAASNLFERCHLQTRVILYDAQVIVYLLFVKLAVISFGDGWLGLSTVSISAITYGSGQFLAQIVSGGRHTTLWDMPPIPSLGHLQALNAPIEDYLAYGIVWFMNAAWHNAFRYSIYRTVVAIGYYMVYGTLDDPS